MRSKEVAIKVKEEVIKTATFCQRAIKSRWFANITHWVHSNKPCAHRKMANDLVEQGV